VVLAGIFKGSVNIPLAKLLVEENQTIIFLRIMRILTGIVAGAGLAVSGIALQSILRNSLAEPYLLGTSSGAGLGAIIALFIFTGLRKKELLNLKLQDVNLERGSIKVYAKNKERLIPLNETAKEYLIDYLKVRPKRDGINNVFVSTNRKASALTGQGLYDLFRELRKKSNIHKKISPQILRHTFCTLMLRNGVNLRDIQLLAGHSDISTTAKFYLGCDDKQLKQAVDRHPLNI